MSASYWWTALLFLLALVAAVLADLEKWLLKLTATIFALPASAVSTLNGVVTDTRQSIGGAIRRLLGDLAPDSEHVHSYDVILPVVCLVLAVPSVVSEYVWNFLRMTHLLSGGKYNATVNFSTLGSLTGLTVVASLALLGIMAGNFSAKDPRGRLYRGLSPFKQLVVRWITVLALTCGGLAAIDLWVYGQAATRGAVSPVNEDAVMGALGAAQVIGTIIAADIALDVLILIPLLFLIITYGILAFVGIATSLASDVKLQPVVEALVGAVLATPKAAVDGAKKAASWAAQHHTRTARATVTSLPPPDNPDEADAA